MRRVKVEELRKIIREGLPAGEKIAVEDGGTVVGHFTPVALQFAPQKKDPEELQRAYDELDAAIEKALEGSTLTRDELADLLDLSKPFPYDD